MSHEDDPVDVAVIGGGPAGCSAALALRRQLPGFRVLLVDRSRRVGPRPAEALASAAIPLLQRIGVWESFRAACFAPASGIASSWGSPELIDNHAVYSPWGAGWHIDRRRFDRLMLDAVALADVEVLHGAHVVGATRAEDSWRLRMREGALRRARFVLDATGRGARFARAQGAVQRVSDQLVGFGRLFRECGDTDSRTVVEAAPEGWWYSCRAPKGRTVVLMTDADIARRMALAREKSWLRRLSATAWVRRLVEGGRVGGEGEAFFMNAFSMRLSPVGGHRWLAVGDAASTVDPLSGCGLSRALRAGITACYAAGDYVLSSDATGVRRYQALHLNEVELHARSQRRFHGKERRWSDEPFWKRRL